MHPAISSVRLGGQRMRESRRAFFLFCASLAAAVAMIVVLPDWLPLVGLALLGVVLYLAYRPDHGLYLLAFLAPFAGLVVNFGAYEWSRAIPYLGGIDAPAVDFLAMLLLLGLIIRAIVQLPARDMSPIRPTPLIGFFVLFLFANILSLALGAQQDLIAQGVKFVVRPVLFVYLMYVILPNRILSDDVRLLRALRWFFAAGVLAAVIGLVSFLIVDPVQGLWHRATPFAFWGIAPLGYNHNLLAEVLVLMAPIGSYLVYREAHATKRKLFFLATVLVTVVALLTFARTAWIVLALELMLFIWFYRYEIRHSIVMKYARKIAIMGFILLLPVMVYMTAISTSDLVAGSTNTRVDLTRIAWEYFKRSPLVGNGPGSFIPIVSDTQVFFIEYGDPLDAHGMIQKVMAENGLLGLITWGALLCAIVAYAFHACMRARDADTRARMTALFIVLVAALAYQLFNTSYYNAKMWLPIGFALVGSQLILCRTNEKQKSST